MARRTGSLALGICLLAALGACVSEPPDPFLQLLDEHASPADPPADTSNEFALDPAAAALGKKFYFDDDFSGQSLLLDMLLRPMSTPGRAAEGEPIGVSCNTCHQVDRGGSDHTSDPPGNVVSIGAGAYDVNGMQTFNAAYLDLVYWNGRNDSLWSQIVAVVESHVSVGGSRLRVAWRIADAYRDEYEAVFGEYPLPAELDSVAAQQARLEPDGTCTLVDGACPPWCHELQGPCLPRFPLEGRPGFELVGQQAECDLGIEDPLQPYGDAYDCMQLEDQLQIVRIYVNFAKAIAAYEFTLLSRDSAFDRWAEDGYPAGALGPAAERGARLFVGKAACSECHSGPMFTDNQFHMIGVPQLGTYLPTTADCPVDGWCDCVSDDRFIPKNCLPIGFRDGLRKLQANRFRRDSLWSDDRECQRHFSVHTDANYAADHPEECDGRVQYYSMALTDQQRGAWKTPPLRDVALTAPYMHNGMYSTLRQVVEHYDRGGVPAVAGELIGTLDPKIEELGLTEQEIDDLVAFLETLDGTIDAAVIAPPDVPAPSPF